MATTASKLASGQARWWASATSKRTLSARPSLAAWRVASSMWLGTTDTPSTSAPVSRAIRRAGTPMPQPRSSTLSPGPTASSAMAFPVRWSCASARLLGSAGESRHPQWKLLPPSFDSSSAAKS